MNPLSCKAAVAAWICACAVGASAQTAPLPGPTIYGVLDLAAGRFQSPGAPRAWDSGSGLTPSYLGLSGSDDLGGGLRARFGLEAYLRADAGAAGSSAGAPFWSRTAFVGLQGAFGTSLLGRLPTPLWIATRRFNPFGESEAFSPTMRQYFGGTVFGDTRWNNSVGFTSPEPEDGRGFTYNVHYNGSEGAPGATGKNVSASVLYTAGPLSATAVWQRVRNGPLPVPVGFDHQTTYHLATSLEFSAVRLYAQAGRVNTRSTMADRTDLVQLGAAAPIGAGFFMVAAGQARERTAVNSTRRTYSAGYDYFLSKTTDLYAVAMHEQATRLSSANSLAAGLRLRF